MNKSDKRDLLNKVIMDMLSILLIIILILGIWMLFWHITKIYIVKIGDNYKSQSTTIRIPEQ